MIEPKNEMGVIVYFAQICKERGYEIIDIQAAFPDAVIKEELTGSTYLVEFEFLASNFFAHKHDLRKCDLVICWVNDLVNSDFPLTIWELSTLGINGVEVVPNEEKELAYLRIENRNLQKRIEALERGIGIDMEESVSVYPSDYIDRIESVLEHVFNLNGTIASPSYIVRVLNEDGARLDPRKSSGYISTLIKNWRISRGIPVPERPNGNNNLPLA